MSKRWLYVFIAIFGYVGMVAYIPRLRVERIYVVVPIRHANSTLVSMRQTEDLKEVRIGSVQYSWLWSYPSEKTFFGAELDFPIDWERLLIQAWVWTWVVVFLMFLYFRSPRPILDDPSRI